ncbi:Bro-N domain-containing protein [Roseateles sp.]|uniref:BRO-N domain-containing protein n=1 Tax=Roseateles sp. TaxID=1971397 RepID=UPI003BA844F3
MSHILPFNFDGQAVRVSVDDGEPWFHAGDVCAALGYSNARDAVARHVDEEDVAKHDTLSPGGSQSANHVNESGLYALVFGSKLESAKRFKRWVTHDVLPSIRRGGTYQLPQAAAANDNIVIAETISRALNLQGSAHLGLIRKAVQKFAPQHVELLPNYAIDAPSGSAAVSSEATAALTELLAEHGIRRSAQAVNKLLEEAGILETLERKSSKCEEMRKFKSVTVAGLRFGKNVVSDRNPRETQPHWYRSTFGSLLVELGIARRVA